MSSPLRRAWLSAFLLLVASASAPAAQTADVEPAKMLPQSAVFYLAIEQPDPILTALTDPAYIDALAGLEPMAKTLRSKEWKKAHELLAVFEDRLGTDWQTALPELVGGGVWFAIDATTQGAVLIVKPRQPKLLEKLLATARELVDADSKQRGKPSPVRSRTFQGVEAWSFGEKEVHAQIDGLLVVTNKNETMKAILEVRAGRQGHSLAQAPDFQQALQERQADAQAWAYANLTMLRAAPQASSLFAGHGLNPLIEILAGGILDAAGRAPHATASLAWKDRQLRFVAGVPRDAAKVAATRRWHFAAETKAGTSEALRPRNLLASLSLSRDLAGMWSVREELFDEKTNVGLTQADTNLGLYFSGRDFGPEVLGEFAPHWQFLAARREYSGKEPVPTFKLPAMAIIVQVKSEAIAEQLLLSYQNLIAIINLQGLQSGRPQLLITADDYHGTKVMSAAHVIPADAPRTGARIEYNFHPACARLGTRFILGSTGEIVRELVDLAKQASGSSAKVDNSELLLEGPEIVAAFKDNRELLVSRAMLSSGKPKDEAARQVDALLDLGRSLEQVGLRILPTADQLQVELTVQVGKP